MKKKAPIKRIHVNQHNIRANAKNGNEDLPVFSIKISGENIKCHSVHINGPSTLVYRPEKPLSCGAKVWIETRADILYVDTTFRAKVPQNVGKTTWPPAGMGVT